jgi:hypothetical protein
MGPQHLEARKVTTGRHLFGAEGAAEKLYPATCPPGCDRPVFNSSRSA